MQQVFVVQAAAGEPWSRSGVAERPGGSIGLVWNCLERAPNLPGGRKGAGKRESHNFFFFLLLETVNGRNFCFLDELYIAQSLFPSHNSRNFYVTMKRPVDNFVTEYRIQNTE